MADVLQIALGLMCAGGVLVAGASLRRRLSPWPWAVLVGGGGVLLLLVAGMVGAVGLGIVLAEDLFGMVRLLTWSLFLVVPVFLVGLGVLALQRSPTVSYGCWALVLLMGLIALDAFVMEPQWLQVSIHEIASGKIAAPARVVVLADIQTDRPGRYERRALERAMAHQPDLLLFAGDYIQLGRRSRAYEDELAALRGLLADVGLQAPLGAYAVGGNVDRPGVWPQAFTGLPVTTMEQTAQVDLGPVVVTGLSYRDASDAHLTVGGQETFHIVLGHTPNFSLGKIDADLLVAGHTHGGQVQLPFIGPLLTLSSVPRSWASGVTQIAPDTTLVVSRGIGLERGNAPRLRFLCRPEVVVIDLVPLGNGE